MLKKSKLAAAALGLLLLSGAGIASADSSGYYPDDSGTGCTAGTFGVSDYDIYHVYAVYEFPAMNNGDGGQVWGTLYDMNTGRIVGSTYATFSCSNGWVTYSGPYSDGPGWD